MMKPLGHRVLIKPDEQPEASESGLIQLPQDRDHVACSGTVVAVGNGSKARWTERQRVFEYADFMIELWFSKEQASIFKRETDAQRMLPTPSVNVGDRVVIPVEAGMNVSEDGVQYVIVNEDDLVIIVEESEAA